MGDPKVSRAAAVLVMAAGGEIRVPMRMIRDAHLIELHQREDPATGDVIYSTRPYARVAGAPGDAKTAILDGRTAVTQNHTLKRLPNLYDD